MNTQPISLPSLCILLAIGSCQNTSEKDREIAALRAQVAKLEKRLAQNSPGRNASQGAPPQAKRPPSLSPPATPQPPAAWRPPRVVGDSRATSMLTLDTDEARNRFAAWAVAFGKDYTPLQRDRAVATLLSFVHENATGLRARYGVQVLDSLGHVRDPAELTEAMQKWLRKAGQMTLMRVCDAGNSSSPEVVYGVLRYDPSLFQELLTELKTTGKITRLVSLPPPLGLEEDFAASWVTIRNADDLKRFNDWRAQIRRGLTPEQAVRVEEKIINHFLNKLWLFYVNHSRFAQFDEFGHFRDLSELTITWRGKYSKLIIQDPLNFGPEAGAAVFNFQK